MIEQLQLRDFQGIRELDVDDLGPFNLIVGANGSGKTGLLAAAGIAADTDGWLHLPPYLSDPRPRALHFERHLAPLCPGMDLSLRPRIIGRINGQPSISSLFLKRGATPLAQVLGPEGDETARATFKTGGRLDALTYGGTENRTWWCPPVAESESTIRGQVFERYKNGTMEAVVGAVQSMDPEVDGLEMAGREIFVRLVGNRLPLHYGILGEGARRMLEFALAIGHPEVRVVLVDELSNSFHVDTLPTVLDLFRGAQAQVFVTTHDAGFVRVACERFIQTHDDGLRVISIERGLRHRTRVYRAKDALRALDREVNSRHEPDAELARIF